MTKKRVVCLFFLFVLVCSGCVHIQYKTNQTKNEGQKSETIGRVEGKQGSKAEKNIDEMDGSKAEKKTDEMDGSMAEEEIVETDSSKEEKEKILVLTYGDKIMTGMAQTICDSIGADHHTISQEETDSIKTSVNEADYILIGTSKEVLELEFAIRNCVDEKELSGKKTALFLLNQEEEKETFETEFMEWYPEAELLPTFTMRSNANLQEELGRMNGWLTTIMTYGIMKE